MADETKKPTSDSPCAAEEIVVSDIPAIEKPAIDVVKDAPPQPETEVEKPAAEEKDGKEEASDEKKITQSASFKEESNKVDDLIDPEKKAIDEFKQLILVALNNHEFTAPPPSSAKEEEKKEEEPKPEEEKRRKKKSPKPKLVKHLLKFRFNTVEEIIKSTSKHTIELPITEAKQK